MGRRGTGFAIALFLLAAGLLYAVWTSGATEVCAACGRHLHAQTVTAGIVDGKQEVFCCPACALTARLQSGKAVRITGLTDFDTGARISPREAYLVKGSDVNLCMRHETITGPHHETAAIVFDRCSPSIIAFASQAAAERFLARHGGAILRFTELH